MEPAGDPKALITCGTAFPLPQPTDGGQCPLGGPQVSQPQAGDNKREASCPQGMLSVSLSPPSGGGMELGLGSWGLSPQLDWLLEAGGPQASLISLWDVDSRLGHEGVCVVNL